MAISRSENYFIGVCSAVSLAPCRLQAAEKQAEKSNREYQMGKIDALKSDVDEATKKFEDCQDAYATELFTFMSKEQLYTEKLLDVSSLILSLFS